MITEALDTDANVIWGARIDNSMTGKLRIMTIVTGVKSPYILGKTKSRGTSSAAREMSEELGIDLLR